MVAHRRLSRALVVAFAVVGLPAGSALAQRPKVKWNAPPKDWHWVIPEKIPGMVHGTLHSESMDRDVGFNVLLPPGYESSPKRRYPVVYYLHGAGGSELSGYELGDVVRRLHRAGTIGDVIYVFPNGGHFSRYRDWKDENVKAETFVIRELIPHVDETYRTIAERKGRALAGWSMGGDASLRFAFKYPESFCAAATMSAAVDWGAAGDDSIFAQAEKNVEKIRGRTKLMMVVGEEDRLYQAHRRLRPHLDRLNIEYTFRSHPGIGHNLGEVKAKSGADLVTMLAGAYAPAADEPAD